MENIKHPNFGLIVVPRSCEDSSLWQSLIEKSKNFRLNALKESPEAFASTYEREVAFTADVWEARLANLQATMLVLVADPAVFDIQGDTEKVQMLLRLDWLAVTVLIEPAEDKLESHSASQSPWSTIAEPRDTNAVESPRDSVTFVLNGVYVPPNHRKIGAGISTLSHVFEVGRAMAKAKACKAVRYEVLVDATNDAAFGLYHKAGFHEVRRELLQVGEKYKDGTVLPAREATIIVMERVDTFAAGHS